MEGSAPSFMSMACMASRHRATHYSFSPYFSSGELEWSHREQLQRALRPDALHHQGALPKSRTRPWRVPQAARPHSANMTQHRCLSFSSTCARRHWRARRASRETRHEGMKRHFLGLVLTRRIGFRVCTIWLPVFFLPLPDMKQVGVDSLWHPWWLLAGLSQRDRDEIKQGRHVFS